MLTLEHLIEKRVSSAIVKSFESAITSALIQWACCVEQHKNGSYYFHMAVLLARAQRWIRVKQRIQEDYDIVVNFSDHPGYYSAYRYVVKEDQAVFKSRNHPTIAVHLRTPSATRARQGKGYRSFLLTQHCLRGGGANTLITMMEK